MKTIFLRPGDYNTQEATNEILNIINNTEETLRIAVAYFTFQPLINALIERKQMRKSTKLILNTSDLVRPISPTESEIFISKDLIRLINLSEDHSNLEVKSLGVNPNKFDYQNMHHKFVVSERKVLFGSLNWTYFALNKNYESIYISEDSTVVNEFIVEFENMWSQAQNIYTSRGRIRGIICPECNDSEGVDLESYGPVCTFCNHRFKVR